MMHNVLNQFLEEQGNAEPSAAGPAPADRKADKAKAAGTREASAAAGDRGGKEAAGAQRDGPSVPPSGNGASTSAVSQVANTVFVRALALDCTQQVNLCVHFCCYYNSMFFYQLAPFVPLGVVKLATCSCCCCPS